MRDIDAVDAVIHLFAPDHKVGSVRVRPAPRHHAAQRNDNSRLLLALLRDADGPMTTRDMTLKVMQARGLNAADEAMADTMRDRVGAALRALRQRGTLESGQGKGASVKWWLAGTGPG